MAEDNLSPTYWNNRYKNKEVGWDIGSISTPIKEYIDQLKDKNITVLIPGCGSGYEGIYLHEKGFPNVTMLDFAQEPLDNLKRNCPSFPQNQLRQMDFFDLDEKFDLIICRILSF